MHKSLDTNKLFVSGKQTSIIKRFFFSKLGILPNYNSRFKLTALFELLLYAFVNGLSAEEASSQLKIELPNSLIASADVLLRRLKAVDERLVQKAFGNTVKRVLKKLGKKPCTIAIDYHDISYYGDKNDLHVRGTKRQRGTNYCHQFATLEIVDGEHRLTLAVKKLSVVDDEKAKVIQELIRLARKHAQITLILLDRAFYGTACIHALKVSTFKFVMPAVKNETVQKKIKQNSAKLPIVVEHSIGDKEKESFNLCMIREKTVDTKKIPDVYCFATNIVTEDAEHIAELYRKRWSIETGYRTKKQFRAKTTTPNNTVRMIYFFMECLLYNAWYCIRTIVSTTIATFKKCVEKLAIKNLSKPIT